MNAPIVVDKTSPLPVHRQIYEAWRSGILSGRLGAGHRVASTRELAAMLTVSRSTVAQAYDQLIAEGYLEAIRGSGTFVSWQLPDPVPRDPGARGRRVGATRRVPLSRFGAGLVEDYPYDLKHPDCIDFAHWEPDPAQFPWRLWRRLLSRHSRAPGAPLFGYAEHVRGDDGLREQIAAYVGRSRGVACTAAQILVVNGSQQGLDLCARLLFDHGDDVSVENPGYPGAIRTFRAYGANLRPVPVDQDGIDCRRLDDAARVVYVTPSHQYPTGVALSLNRRLELLAWARKRGAIIIEDDYDSEYRYVGAPLPALQGLAEEVPVIYCGTFSKVMFPGLRIGYLILPDALLPAFTRAKRLADNFTPLLEQLALRDFIAERHLERHVRRMRRLYGRRRQALVESLWKHFGADATVLGEPAGMHAYVHIQAFKLMERAQRNRVQLRSAHSCFLADGGPNDYLLGFSGLTERTIREGVRRLAR